MTNDRIQADVGNLFLLNKQDWVTGPGATVVMAAFTHTGHASRFSDGSYGVYYAGMDEETAIAETVFHQERRLRETSEAAIELDMRCYTGKIVSPMDDIRGKAYLSLQQPDLNTWPDCQRFGAERRADRACGLLYRSARKRGGECIAAFQPKAVTRPTQSKHLRYCWNGTAIDRVLSVTDICFR